MISAKLAKFHTSMAGVLQMAALQSTYNFVQYFPFSFTHALHSGMAIPLVLFS